MKTTLIPQPDSTMFVIATQRALQALPPTGSTVIQATTHLTKVTFAEGTRFTEPESEYGSYYFGVQFRPPLTGVDLELVYDTNEHLSWPWMLIAPSVPPVHQHKDITDGDNLHQETQVKQREFATV